MPDVKFRHLDDEKWQEVRAIELPTGRASAREKWLDPRRVNPLTMPLLRDGLARHRGNRRWGEPVGAYGQ